MSIVRIEITMVDDDADFPYHIMGSREFTVDTDKIKPLIGSKEIHYINTEMESVLSLVEKGDQLGRLPDGHDKYSIYDTPWEYDLVKADPGARFEYLFKKKVNM